MRGCCTYLIALGDEFVESPPCSRPLRTVSTAGALSLSPPTPLAEGATAGHSSVLVVWPFSEVGVLGSPVFFWSLNLCSNPSTLFSSASSTSVFGPLFLGTASTAKEKRGHLISGVNQGQETSQIFEVGWVEGSCKGEK
jgi:hypothetical protein